MNWAALTPYPNGYRTTNDAKSSPMGAMGNKKTSVLVKNGNERYPRWVMYQYQQNAAPYMVLASKSGTRPLPKTTGKVKNCSPSVYQQAAGIKGGGKSPR
jgi:hypothetical protein